LVGALANGANAQVLPGDVDGDGVVELEDFTPIRNHFRQTVTMRVDGDLTSDGLVDFHDFRQWKAAFLGSGLEAASRSAPEPGTFALAGLAFAAAAAARRRSR
jgi:hypothetical protein